MMRFLVLILAVGLVGCDVKKLELEAKQCLQDAGPDAGPADNRAQELLAEWQKQNADTKTYSAEYTYEARNVNFKSGALERGHGQIRFAWPDKLRIDRIETYPFGDKEIDLVSSLSEAYQVDETSKSIRKFTCEPPIPESFASVSPAILQGFLLTMPLNIESLRHRFRISLARETAGTAVIALSWLNGNAKVQRVEVVLSKPRMQVESFVSGVGDESRTVRLAKVQKNLKLDDAIFVPPSMKGKGVTVHHSNREWLGLK